MERSKRQWKRLGWVSVIETFGRGILCPTARDLPLVFLVVSLDGTFGDFNLAFQFLVHRIDQPEALDLNGDSPEPESGDELRMVFARGTHSG